MLWAWYMQLVQVEEAFKTLKGDLHRRPIHHQIGPRVEAHILVAFLASCWIVTLRMKLKIAAPGLTPREVLKSLSAIQRVDVHIPATDGRVLLLPRYTEPEGDAFGASHHHGLRCAPPVATARGPFDVAQWQPLGRRARITQR